MSAKGKEEPPGPEVIVEYPESDQRTGVNGTLPRAYVREYRSNSGKGFAYSYVYYGPKRGRLSSVKLGLGLAALMAGVFFMVALGGLIFLGLAALVAVVATVGRILKRK